MTNALRESMTSMFGYTIAGIFSVGAWRIAIDIALKQKEVKTRIIIILAATAILLIVIYGIVGKMNSQPAKTMAAMQQFSQKPTKKTAPILPTPPKPIDLTNVHEMEKIITVPGKTARECAKPDGTMDNETVQCMKPHVEWVKMSEAEIEEMRRNTVRHGTQ